MRVFIRSIFALCLAAVAVTLPVQQKQEQTQLESNQTDPAPPFDDLEDPELIGGFFEGDMEITVQRNVLIKPAKRWPYNLVPYKIDKDFDLYHVLYLEGAMRAIESVSCIRFLPATEDTIDYVYITGKSSGCHSKVGYRGNQQTMNLRMDPINSGCFKFGTILHELLHTLGFYHQQSAVDRDYFVRIVLKNIKPNHLRNFHKYTSSVVTDFGIPYDYYSVMHYSDTAFSRNGRKTIVPLLDERIEIGQRIALSPGDVAKLNVMYKCWPLITHGMQME